MQKIMISKRIYEGFLKNKWQSIFVFATLLIGIFSGTIYAIIANAEISDGLSKYLDNFVSAYNLQPVNKLEIFKHSIYYNIKDILFLCISGLWVGFLPLLFFQLGIKGYKTGFVLTIIVKKFGIKGIFFGIASMIHQILIQFPLYILYSIFIINFALWRHKTKNRSISQSIKNGIYIRYLLYLLISVSASSVISLFDAYIVPVMLKPIFIFWG